VKSIRFAAPEPRLRFVILCFCFQSLLHPIKLDKTSVKLCDYILYIAHLLRLIFYDENAGDGQVTLGDQIVKKGAVKVRKLNDGKVIAGFAGATADAFTLMEKFESYLSTYKGNLMRSAVETVKEWRTDRALRNLEAMMIVADEQQILMLSGVGDVITPDEKVVVVGSGGAYAQAAAVALLRHSTLGAEEIARNALQIAADIDIYTSGNMTVLTVGKDGDSTDKDGDDDGNDDE
jgi:ATP-dependent HslUV protease, peptidase subunit HslV